MPRPFGRLWYFLTCWPSSVSRASGSSRGESAFFREFYLRWLLFARVTGLSELSGVHGSGTSGLGRYFAEGWSADGQSFRQYCF